MGLIPCVPPRGTTGRSRPVRNFEALDVGSWIALVALVRARMAPRAPNWACDGRIDDVLCMGNYLSRFCVRLCRARGRRIEWPSRGGAMNSLLSVLDPTDKREFSMSSASCVVGVNQG